MGPTSKGKGEGSGGEEEEREGKRIGNGWKGTEEWIGKEGAKDRKWKVRGDCVLFIELLASGHVAPQLTPTTTITL